MSQYKGKLTTKHVEQSISTQPNVAIPLVSFIGITALIVFRDEEKKKLKVMVKIFGRKTPLELSYMQVEKI